MIKIRKYIYLLGQKIRNPSLDSIYIELKKSEQLSFEELKHQQLNKLKEIIQFAYNNSSFYRDLYLKHNIHPSDIKKTSDIIKIPIITKDDLIKHNKAIHTTTKYKFKKLFKAVSSGTTGDSLSFRRDEYADSFNRAAIYRGYSWYSVNPWDLSGYFWGFNFSIFKRIKTRFLDYLVNRYRLFSYDEKNLLKFINIIYKAKYIEGYSSMIYQTAKFINDKKLVKPKNLKMVKGTSEKIYSSYQNEVEKAFNTKIISEYGAAEAGIIAFECPKGQMHINTEGVFIEEIDGEILITNLIMKSFPIIRYKLGDYIKLKKNNDCTCNLSHPVLEEVTGRVGENIYGKKNIYPSLYFYYIFKNLEKNNHIALTYQIYQNEKGKLIFNISEKIDMSKVKILRKEIYKYFNDDIDFEINIDVPLLKNRKGKIKSFVSKIC